MIDLRVFTEQPELVKDTLRRRHADDQTLAAVDRIDALSEERRTWVTERDTLRADRNRLSKEIGGLFKQGKRDEAEALKAQVQAGAERIKELEQLLGDAEGEIRELAMSLPNLLHPEVPEGKSEDDNVVVKTWGEPRQFDFEPQAHVEVGEAVGILDLEASAKLSGARFAVLKGWGAKLERALNAFFLDQADQAGYTEVQVPYIVQAHCAEGTSQLPKFAEDMFKLEGELNGSPAYLIPTAEVPVTNLHRDEILESEQLPVQYCAFTPCFRSEAGSAGRDVRGLIRQHQFHKVEGVWLTTPERAEADHMALVGHAEGLLEKLGLPYRTMLLCSGDTSFGAYRCFDIEVWLPTQGYREISSCSHFIDFQARRMNTRYRPEPEPGSKKKAKPRFVHTLNGSILPSGRTLVAILENNQQADGSVIIPEVLRPYLGGLERIDPKE